MKGYYICLGEVGVNLTKKIGMQTEELKKVSEITEIYVRRLRLSQAGKWLYRAPFSRIPLWDYQEALGRISEPDYIYIRRGIADNAYMAFLGELRKRYPECRIIVEIFTYPYDKDEFSDWKMWWPYYVRECVNRRRYKRYIDRFVTYSEDDSIFHVPTLRSFNGIHVEDYPLRKHEPQGNEIHLLAVAMFRKHHGYERIIRGLADYTRSNPPRQVILYLVGNGPERERYQSLCTQLGVRELVVFEGLLNGKELDAIYNRMDIALGSFAMYKNDLYLSSALKIREYLARGIPVMSGCREDVLSGKGVNFYKEYPNDDTTVEIGDMVDYYEKKIENNPLCAPGQIRQYAMQTVSMAQAMRPVVDFLTGGRQGRDYGISRER